MASRPHMEVALYLWLHVGLIMSRRVLRWLLNKPFISWYSLCLWWNALIIIIIDKASPWLRPFASLLRSKLVYSLYLSPASQVKWSQQLRHGKCPCWPWDALMLFDILTLTLALPHLIFFNLFLTYMLHIDLLVLIWYLLGVLCTNYWGLSMRVQCTIRRLFF
jgi:hypothetical protein